MLVRLYEKKQTYVREHLEKTDRKINPRLTRAALKQDNKGKKGSSKGKDSKKIICSVINYGLIIKELEDFPVLDNIDVLTGEKSYYSIVNTNYHLYSKSTLIDNCALVYIVNNQSLIDIGTFVASNPSNVLNNVSIGTSLLGVQGFGTRTFKRALRTSNSNLVDLVLKNVYVIKNFHVNIISEARLLEKGVQFCGADYTLRIREVKNSRVIKDLTRRSNIVFFKYNKLSYLLDLDTCKNAFPVVRTDNFVNLDELPTNPRVLLLYLSKKRLLKRLY